MNHQQEIDMAYMAERGDANMTEAAIDLISIELETLLNPIARAKRIAELRAQLFALGVPLCEVFSSRGVN